MIKTDMLRMIASKISNILNPKDKNVWVEIREGRRSMPKKSQEIIYRTDTGFTFVGFWNAHEKAIYHYNVDFESGKVVPVRIKRFRTVVAWTYIPEDNEGWE